MTRHLQRSSTFGQGQICLQLMGWVIAALVTFGPSLESPLLINSPPASTDLQPDKQSGRGKSRYTRMTDIPGAGAQWNGGCAYLCVRETGAAMR